MNSTPLSFSQRRILRSLGKLIDENGESPTVQELANEAIYSYSWTSATIKVLEDKKFIKRGEGWRNMKITAKGRKAIARKA